MQLSSRAQARTRPDDTLIKALARAFRRKRMLETGDFATVAELAAREGIAVSYLTRLRRLAVPKRRTRQAGTIRRLPFLGPSPTFDGAVKSQCWNGPDQALWLLSFGR
jgi:hypothetical protein